MILEYMIACDNCNCVIDGKKDTFLEEAVDGDRDYGVNQYCNEDCKDGGMCPKCNSCGGFINSNEPHEGVK